MKKILVISYSSLNTDMRVHRQIISILPKYEITFAGRETDPKIFEENIQFFRSDKFKSEKIFNFYYNYPAIFRKPFSLFFRVIFKIREFFVKKNPSLRYWNLNIIYLYFKLRKLKFDCIIANDLNALPLATSLKKLYQCSLIFDAHEYYFDEHSQNPFWVKTYLPAVIDVSKKSFSKIDKMMTVSQGLADLYEQHHNFKEVEVITSASQYYDLHPQLLNQDSGEKIKIIHHGFYTANRNIEAFVDMMHYLPEDKYELYLMLIQVHKHGKELLKKIESFPNIILLDPVPSKEIAAFTNKFDIGVIALPPTSQNLTYALPNKFFEYVQARLAIVSGPSIEQKRIIEKYELGKTASDFEGKSLADAILSLSVNEINYYKRQANIHALELSFETNRKKILEIVTSQIESLPV